MKTSDRVQQLMALPINQAPAPAVQLVKFLSSKYGICGEIYASAYEAYAIVFEQTEGGECSEECRRFLAAIKPESFASPAPITRDWAQQQQDREELAETVNMLGSFINQYSPLELERSRVLALAILENGQCSGVVSAARAARLLAEAAA